MNSFFKTIRLYEQLNFQTKIDNAEFIEKLEKHIYKSDFSIFETADFSIPDKFEYKGYVNKTGFLIRRRRHIFDNNILNPFIKGIINDEDGKTLIKIEFIPVKYITLSLIFPIVFLILFFSNNFQRNFDISFIVIIPLILSLNHYFTLKRNIKRGKYDFERELNFIVHKND